MNGEFDFNQNNNGLGNENPLQMTPDEKKHHKCIFSKLCFAFVAYMAVTEGLAFLLSYLLSEYAPSVLESNNFSIIISSVLQYVIAFPILYFIIRRVPASRFEGSKLSPLSFLKYATVSVMFMQIGSYISSFVMTIMYNAFGKTPENTVDTLLDQTDIWLSVLIVGIIGPIFEELMFRKLFIDRLRPYGDAVAVFFPALIFGLFHGNLYQFFYAFFLGAALSYIYVRTGKIIYTMSLHMFINLFCGVFPSYLMSLLDYEEFLRLTEMGTLTEDYIMENALPIILLGAYSVIIYASMFGGVYFFTKNLRGLRFEKGKCRIPSGEGADVMFFNPGAIALITLCLIFIALNTFSMQ